MKLLTSICLVLALLMSSCATISSNNVRTLSNTESVPIITSKDPRKESQLPAKKLDLLTKFSIGVNLAGGEFGDNQPNRIPGTLGSDYNYPDCSYLQKWTDRGVKVFRYPVRIERLIRNGKLTDDVTKIREALDCAAQERAGIILDFHNYGRLISNGQEVVLTAEKLAEAASLVAGSFQDHPGLIGLGLQNEPHDMPSTDYWPKLAQAGIDAVRKVDPHLPILVSGDNWSGTQTWHTNDGLKNLSDPSSQLIFEAHSYFDQNASGQYACGSAPACNASAGFAINRLKPFVEWCDINNLNCIIGEMGIPVADQSWEPILKEALNYLREHDIPVILWAAGPWWDSSYPLSLDHGNDWIFKILNR